VGIAYIVVAKSGMSGSPLLDARGRAIGVVTASNPDDLAGPHGPQPILFDHLPGWLLRSCYWSSPSVRPSA
jgi:hypothetical protein